MSDTQDKGQGDEWKNKKVTIQKPFKITEPKPKKQKEEEPPVEPFHPKPVPDFIYNTNLDAITNEKKAKRDAGKEQTKEKYSKGAQPFKFKTDERPMYLEEIKKQVEEEEQNQLKFNMKHHEAPLNFKEIEAEVRMNAAAIMREHHLLQKNTVEEEKKLKSYEVDLHNSGEFDRWQKEMKEKDEIEKMQLMQKRKLEMQMSRDEAVAACKNKLKENQVLVEKVKIESENAMKEREEKKEEDFQHKIQLRNVVLEAKDNVAKEKEKVIEKNQKIREEIEKEIEEVMRRKKEEDIILQQNRDEVIRKIRELEHTPIERKTGFDPTETAGHGLLQEMSLAELREKLEAMKKERADEEERIRTENLKKKEGKTKILSEKSERIAAAREKKAKENERIREEKSEKPTRKRKESKKLRKKAYMKYTRKFLIRKKRKRKKKKGWLKN